MNGLVSANPEHESIRQAIEGISHMAEEFRAFEREGHVDIGWIMARYKRTVVLPLIDDERYLADVRRLTSDLRIRLQEAWTWRSADAEEIVSVLMQWCAVAESTGGVQALGDFVAELRSYVFPSPARVPS